MNNFQINKRNEVDLSETWDLSDLFSDFESWLKFFEKLPAENELKKILDTKFRNQLKTSPEIIHECFQFKDNLMRQLENLYVYANLKLSEDVADNRANEFCGKISSKLASISALFSFLEPELVQIENLEIWSKETPLNKYTFRIKNILKYKPHLLSEKEEALLSQLSVPLGVFSDIHSKWSNADLKFNSVKDSKNNDHVVSQSRYGLLMQSEDRTLRKNAFDSYYSEISKWRNTISSNYFGTISTGSISSKIRNFSGYLEQELFGDDIPVTLYDNLITSVKSKLNYLHESMELRCKKLKIEKVSPYDRYAPLFTSESPLKFSWEEGRDLVLKSLVPLGNEYVEIAKKGLTTERWIDRCENEGKRSGAFSWGTHDSRPYILQTWNGTLNDVFTLAHELGHSMHSYYSHKSQPFHTSSYTIFVAEVASTLNEALLADYLLNEVENNELKKSVLSKSLENFEATVLRQVLFAAYEKEASKITDTGNTFTPDTLDEIYIKLNKEWYGENSDYPEFLKHEWMRIPHFYSPFYVYKYATSYCASASLFFQLKQNKENGLKNIFSLLKAGGSDTSLNILKSSGVDMLSTEPINFAFQNYKKLLDFSKSF